MLRRLRRHPAPVVVVGQKLMGGSAARILGKRLFQQTDGIFRLPSRQKRLSHRDLVADTVRPPVLLPKPNRLLPLFVRQQLPRPFLVASPSQCEAQVVPTSGLSFSTPCHDLAEQWNRHSRVTRIEVERSAESEGPGRSRTGCEQLIGQPLSSGVVPQPVSNLGVQKLQQRRVAARTASTTLGIRLLRPPGQVQPVGELFPQGFGLRTEGQDCPGRINRLGQAIEFHRLIDACEVRFRVVWPHRSPTLERLRRLGKSPGGDPPQGQCTQCVGIGRVTNEGIRKEWFGSGQIAGKSEPDPILSRCPAAIDRDPSDHPRCGQGQPTANEGRPPAQSVRRPHGAPSARRSTYHHVAR